MKVGQTLKVSGCLPTDPCVKVDSGYTAPTQMTMYTGETCQQFCRGADQSLAFWRDDVRLCNCFDAIPIFTGSSYCYYTQDTIDPDIGLLYITEMYSNVKFNNCVEIFNEGIFYSGQYIVMNGSKVVCYFFDNSTTSCSANWVAYKGNCYLFLDKLRDMSDHHYNSCIPQGSHLVSVGDVNEGNFITNAMSKMAHVKLLPVFIGLYDIQQTFSYMWVDETAFTFRNFADDYPKIIINRCVVYDRGTMKNSDCSSLNGAICEISQSTVGCVSTNATQLQLKTVSSKMSTPFCFESCRSSGYRYSATRNISCFCGNDSSQFTPVDWQQCDTRCPRHKYQLCGGNETGTVFVTADIGQPYRESCLSMILGSLLSNVTVKTSNGTLQNVDCLEYAGVICPESWVEIDGRCYRFFIESIEDPSLMCSNIGSYLVVYETDEEAKSVPETIQSAPLLSSQARWTFGLFHHRPQTSYLRYASGAYVNESLKSLLDEDSFSCYAHTSFDAKNITGVLCNRYSYICERGPDFLGCYMSLSPQYQRLSGYRDLTVTQCLETCKGLGKRLAGIKFQTACYCIENENITKATNDYLCEKTCCFQQSCGSAVNDYMTVYEIDYSKNASSCKELFNQGVLLSGLYSLSKGVTTWCGMKDSQYLAQQVEIWSMNGTSDVNFTDLTWHRVGAANVTLAVDVTGGSKSSLLYQRCDGVFKLSSIMATVKTKEVQQLVCDILKWSLDSPVSIPAYVGLVDQFYMGTYTWSDGSLFRLSQINWTEVSNEIFINSTLNTYMLYTENGDFQGQNSVAPYHAVCQRDASYQGCLLMTSVLPLNLYAVMGYNSMTLTACRQICQINSTNEVLVSSKDCICYDPIQRNFDLMTYFNYSKDALCDFPCPGSELQKCGGTNYFRRHTVETDRAQSCDELYSNFVVLPNNYLINDSSLFCGIDDLSTDCPAGFIAKDKKCFRFYRQQTNNIFTAAQMCLAQGSFLASPTTMNDLYLLKSIIQSVSSLATAKLWLVGLYSPFINGYYVTSQGHMISAADPLVANIKPSSAVKMAIALNVTSGQLVTVSSATPLPFICQTQKELSGCAKINKSATLTSLTLTNGMSIQQCLAFCLGFTKQLEIFSLLQETQCLCMKADSQLNLTQTTCKKPCSGHFMQRCGSSVDGVYSVYMLGNMITISLFTSLDNIYFESHPDNMIQANATTVQPIWFALSRPVVAQWVKIQIESWTGSNPTGSVALIGYAYSEHYFTYHYMGCRANLIVGSDYLPVSSDYESCRTLCKERGFPYLILKSLTADVCQCVGRQPTRDFYASDAQSCSSSCFDSYPCSSLEQYQALYLTTDVSCPLVNVSNSNVSWNVIVNSTALTMFPLKSQVTYSCHVGHEMNSTLSSVTSTCYNFERWIPSLTNISCERVNCNSFPTIPNAQIIVKDNMTTLYGEIVQYSCQQEGYTFNGTIPLWNMTCNEFKLWTPAALPCQTVKCLNKPVVLNAAPNDSGSVSFYNSAINYTCDDGCFFPSDNQTVKTIQCLITGQWSEIEPSCQRLQCSRSPPEMPSSTIITANQSSSAFYSCVNGTYFTDQSKLKETVCSNITFLWSDVQDSCQIRDYVDAKIWLEHNNTYLSDQPDKQNYTRSLIDCAIKCIGIAGCSMFNFNQNNVPFNCRLFVSNRNNFTSVNLENWKIYFVNRS
ncbi:hypothetical protein Btru_051246 [Bulinus truncatus]|nr:hypothetical protein Btru_051246 [Bulinus truncatus]